jgi:hypothetical protein
MQVKDRRAVRLTGANRGNTIPARRIAALLMATLTTTWILGCGVEETALPGNLPPRTYLAILGDTLNVTNYQTILHWWGTDTDGVVIGYAYRWSNPWEPEPEDSLWWQDTTWVFTTATLDTFDVPICGSYAERTFEVCAIDNELAADPQPLSQWFPLENAIPLVSWSDTTRHPTLEKPSLPAISFAWTPEDYDGRETIAYARLWLDTTGGEDSAASAITVVTDTVGAFFPEHFQGRSGERTVFLQIFDRARTGSNTISWTWNVVEPAGDYLLIDNAGESTPGPQRTDDLFWRARMDALVPSDYHIYDVWEEGPFRSRQEILPLFCLFKGVVWYGGKHFDGSTASDQAMKDGLELAETALVDYVSGGGGVFVTGHNLIGTEAGLSRSFWQNAFGIETIFAHSVDEEWITNITLPRKEYGESVHLRCGPRLDGADSLKVNSPITMTDFFRISEALEPLLWLDPATIDTTVIPEHATEPIHVAALAEWGSGRMGLASTILTRLKEGGTGTPEEALEAVLRDVLALP